MTDSAFDPQAFLNGTFNQGVDTRIPLHKPGDWVGMVGVGDKSIAVRAMSGQYKDGTPYSAIAMDVWLETEDPSAVEEGGIAPARARYSIWADTKADGNIDLSPGKSRSLGHLLTALGFQDKSGKVIKPWSPQAFKGLRVKYRVVHDVRKDNGEPVANVSAVLPA